VWPGIRACNQRLEQTAFKSSMRSSFRAYQQAVRALAGEDRERSLLRFSNER
jgi:hypothetical protein